MAADGCVIARRADALPLALNGLKKLLLWLFAEPHKFQLLTEMAFIDIQAEPGERTQWI